MCSAFCNKLLNVIIVLLCCLAWPVFKRLLYFVTSLTSQVVVGQISPRTLGPPYVHGGPTVDATVDLRIAHACRRVCRRQVGVSAADRSAAWRPSYNRHVTVVLTPSSKIFLPSLSVKRVFIQKVPSSTYTFSEGLTVGGIPGFIFPLVFAFFTDVSNWTWFFVQYFG